MVKCKHGFHYRSIIDLTKNKDSAMMVVDYFFKMSYFIPCHNMIDVSHIADLKLEYEVFEPFMEDSFGKDGTKLYFAQQLIHGLMG